MEQYIDEFGNLQFRAVGTNNEFPFVNISQFAEGVNEGKSIEQIIKENTMKQFNLGTNFGNTQSGFATNFPYQTNVQPVENKTGITQSTAAKQFEEPFQIINGQKVYISDILGTRQAEEKANVFQEPKGILTQAKDFITQQLPKTLKGGLDTLVNFIPGMRFVRAIDKFDTLPYMDRKFIESRMGGDVPGISVDPRTGLLTDAAGLNVRSLRGNYAEAVDDEYERYSKAIERAKEKYGVGFDGTQFTGANADIANKMNDRNINMFNFFKNQKAAKDKQIADVRAKMKKQVEAGVTADKGQAMHGGGDGGGFDKAKYEAGKASAIAQEQSNRDYARGKFS